MSISFQKHVLQHKIFWSCFCEYFRLESSVRIHQLALELGLLKLRGKALYSCALNRLVTQPLCHNTYTENTSSLLEQPSEQTYCGFIIMVPLDATNQPSLLPFSNKFFSQFFISFNCLLQSMLSGWKHVNGPSLKLIISLSLSLSFSLSLTSSLSLYKYLSSVPPVSLFLCHLFFFPVLSVSLTHSLFV